MATLVLGRAYKPIFSTCLSRTLATATPKAKSTTKPDPSTHFKITLRRSAIALGEKKKETLVSLGIHRRMQTVYHRHCPEVAGKILKVKELVEVENVPAHMVRTQSEQRLERRPPRGYVVRTTKLAELPWES
ncbi:hypothetical protein SERLA73DRAFT_182313 [Serpula lacrymans var. lacrymans S7.3]|uniref:Large ribosomal subunit protein uL30m n=2 Tax=Serpula lacrymans var. lacrymans TaxID=341189 RepID=F8PX87_SERL3|nr:uncharacterized protein SERLADRAFT_468903 [Serpula lacrymans var. lacrymans S7.9]EGN99362.1 hypothetical protein SERLA73DRAFT_182313 [Serpula lacrymans var. lacrymans S7.3]EGO24924.1 hypothetical protein SERLADRAFT_468903 [Serpula lacrymans var. lacrymans S7.9]